MRSLRSLLFIIGIVFLFLFSTPFISGFSGSDFLDGYTSFISKYLLFFKGNIFTGHAVNEPPSSGSGAIQCTIDDDCPLAFNCVNGACKCLHDINNDGNCNIFDQCSSNAQCSPNYICKTFCKKNTCTKDQDNDGVCDPVDNCRTKYNPDQSDVDEDGVGDVCDNCQFKFNPDQKDTDKDGKGDVCDEIQDTDGDGVPDDEDNCPTNFNPEQEDDDQDGKGNACDFDQCPSGRSALCEEECPNDPGPADMDKDGYAYDGCHDRKITCELQLQCCKDVKFTFCGDCDDVNDDIGRSSHPGAPELCGDGADNDCNGKIDDGCDGGSEEELEKDRSSTIIIRKGSRIVSAHEAISAENLDLDSLEDQLVKIQEDLAKIQTTVKVMLAYLYTTDSTGQAAQQLAYLQTSIEQLSADARSLVAEIKAEQSKDLIFEDLQRFMGKLKEVTAVLDETLELL